MSKKEYKKPVVSTSGEWNRFREPATLILHTTSEGGHGSAEIYSKGHEGALDTEAVLALLTEAVAIGIKTAVFGGSEPLAHPGLIEMMTRSKKLGLQTILTTGGTLLDATSISQIARVVDQVGVVFEGPRALHDPEWGDGAMDTAFCALRDLEAAGVLSLAHLDVTSDNIDHIPGVIETIHANGCRRVKLSPITSGRRGKTLAALAPEGGRLDALAHEVANIMKNKEDLKVNLGFPPKELAVAHPCTVYAISGPGCHQRRSADPRELHVLPDGLVLPVTLVDDRYAVGKLGKTGLRAMLKGYIDQKQHFFLICAAMKLFNDRIAPYEHKVLPWYTMFVEETRKDDAWEWAEAKYAEAMKAMKGGV